MLGTAIPLTFLNGRRSIESVLSRNVRLRQEFRAKYGESFRVVREYYEFRRDHVELVDAEPFLKKVLGNLPVEAVAAG